MAQPAGEKLGFGYFAGLLGGVAAVGFAAEHEFNTIRLFFSMQNLNENKPTRGGYDAQANPELAGTDYDGARAFLQGLGYATKAPARTVRGRRYVHMSGARITLLRVEGTPGYLVEFALTGDDEASLLELRESLPVTALD